MRFCFTLISQSSEIKLVYAFAVSASSVSGSSAKAAYRFWGKEVITYEDIRDSISKATIEKLSQIETKEILLIQDTTAVSFGNRRNIEGMGYYCDSAQNGRD